MLAALCTSAAFLASYLYYHAHVGHVHFPGHGWSRPLYFSILLSHTVLAVIIVPMILVTLSRALRSRYALHRAIARWTFPLWMYVSVTGVVIYLMLYKLFERRARPGNFAFMLNGVKHSRNLSHLASLQAHW